MTIGQSSPLKEPKLTSFRSRFGLFFGPAVFLCILTFLDLDPTNPLVTRMAAVIVLMAIWWITEAIPLAATALLPIVLFPLLGIMRGREIAAGNRIDSVSYTHLTLPTIHLV